MRSDLTLTPTFVVKVGNVFAHGVSVKEAYQDAVHKYNSNLSIEDKIELFKKEFNLVEKYSVAKFYDWHGILTHSCTQGRDVFMEEKSLKLTDTITVSEFIKLTKDSYGGDVIKELNNALNI